MSIRCCVVKLLLDHRLTLFTCLRPIKSTTDMTGERINKLFDLLVFFWILGDLPQAGLLSSAAIFIAHCSSKYYDLHFVVVLL